jgi:hypothetical protein
MGGDGRIDGLIGAHALRIDKPVGQGGDVAMRGNGKDIARGPAISLRIVAAQETAMRFGQAQQAGDLDRHRGVAAITASRVVPIGT